MKLWNDLKTKQLEHYLVIPKDIWRIFDSVSVGGYLPPTMTDLLSLWRHSKTLRFKNNIFNLLLHNTVI
jgi:hypothetical protein